MPTKLFLPFTPRGRQIEERAISIKADHGFGPYEAVAPFDLATRMGVMVVDQAWFSQLPEELTALLLGEHRDSWSAGSVSSDGTPLVVVNPTHSETRGTMSLGEELVHEALGHPKSQIIELDGVTFRICDHAVEDEAYSVAAALVLPYQTLFNHVNAGRPLTELPTPAPVSDSAREFRVKRSGLWATYQARRRKAVSRA